MSIPTDLFINSISTFKNFRETRYSTLYCTSRKLLLFFSQAIPFRRFFFSLSSLFPLHYYYCLLFVSSLLRVVRFSLRYLFSLLFSFAAFYLLASLRTLSCVPYHSIYYTLGTQSNRFFKFLSSAVAPATISIDNSRRNLKLVSDI